jgi:hypothetical protein
LDESAGYHRLYSRILLNRLIFAQRVFLGKLTLGSGLKRLAEVYLLKSCRTSFLPN